MNSANNTAQVDAATDPLIAMDSARAADARAGRRLEYLTLGWNVVEAGVCVTAGVLAGSVALVGFGVDAVIESLSGAILLWRLWSHTEDSDRERLALRLVGLSFLILAAYVAFGAARSLVDRQAPDVSPVGIAIAAVSVVIMPVISRAKRRVAARLGSLALKADSRQTSLCAYLSAILLAGLGLNALFGWWWSDPVAALIMVRIIVREGVEALRGEACADCH